MSTDSSDQRTGTTTETPSPWSGLRDVDTSTSVKLTSNPLNGFNFQQWTKAVSISLEGRGLLEFITGEMPKPNPTTNPADYKLWRRIDCQIISLIQACLEPKIAEIFFNFNSSKELWDAIAKHYGKRKNHSHIYHLKQRIQKITQTQRSILEYSTDLKRGWEELNLYLHPTSDPNILKERENEQVYRFLGGLDDSYDTVRAQILLSPELPRLDDVMASIEGEETRRLLMAGNTSEQERSEAQAMAVKHPNSKIGKKNWCEHCKKDGHEKNKCWFLHPELRPKWWKEKSEGRSWAENPKGEKEGRKPGAAHAEREVKKGMDGKSGSRSGNGSGSDASLTREDLKGFFDQLAGLLQPKFRPPGGSILLPSNIYNINLAQIDLNKHSTLSTRNSHHSVNNCTKGRLDWVLDSGATDHMTGNINLLHNFKKANTKEFVIVANGNKMEIGGYGSIKLFSKIIDNVLFVENCNSNLLSLGKLVRELNCKIIFSSNKVFFQDVKSKMMIGEGVSQNGLYILEK